MVWQQFTGTGRTVWLATGRDDAIGAALMRSGWLKGQFSLRHYVVLVLCWWRLG